MASMRERREGGTASVSVEELVAVTQRKNGRIPYEVGAFLVLQACELLLRHPVLFRLEHLHVAEDGTVLLVHYVPGAAREDILARQVVSLLASLLVMAGPEVPSRLLALVDARPRQEESPSLTRLKQELHAILAPLGRESARQMLARFVRETQGDDRFISINIPPPDGAAVYLDAELDAFLHRKDSGTSRSPFFSSPEGMRAPGAPIVLSDTLPEVPMPHAGAYKEMAEVASWDAQETTLPSDAPFPLAKEGPIVSQVAPPRGGPSTDLPEEDTYIVRRPAKSTLAPFWVWASVVLLAAAAIAAYFVWLGEEAKGAGRAPRPTTIREAKAPKSPTEHASTKAAPPRELPAAQAGEAQKPASLQGVELIVRPEGAQVWLHEGEGPLVLENVDASQTQVFAAAHVEEGASRVVVSLRSLAEGKEGSLVELAIQCDPQRRLDEVVAEPYAIEKAEPAPGGEARRTKVRIVTSPPGARIYRLIGRGPRQKIEWSAESHAPRILVASEGYFMYRGVLDAELGKFEPSARVPLSIELRPIPNWRPNKRKRPLP